MITNELPPGFQAQSLGLSARDIRVVEVIRKRKTHSVYRLTCETGQYVLKWFEDAPAKEINCYALLRRYGVPTLPVVRQTDHAILIEDLSTSRSWRLATEEDAGSVAFGKGLATWYKRLHAAGYEAMGDPESRPDFLQDWVTDLTRERLEAVGAKLDIGHLQPWTRAVESIESLREAFRRLRQTINYNDFYSGNAAVSRGEDDVQVVVFDYEGMVLGPAYTDYRNVSNSLLGEGRASFQDAYGPCDPREAVLDKPLAVIYAISCAAEYPALPGWARECLAAVEKGSLGTDIGLALSPMNVR
jgi:hypothetical protein